MANNQEQTGQNINKIAIVAVLLIGAFVAILNETLLVTALPHIMKEFGVSPNTAQWLTTGFMLTNGVMIPVTAFLIERFTTRALFFTAMGVFTAGTVIGGLAFNFPLLLAGRIIQAAGAGIMLPLMMNVFLSIFPVNQRGTAMGMAGLVIAFAPAIGPTLSGWILQDHSWRLLFFVILPVAIIVIILSAFTLKNVTERSSPSIDVLSIILSSLGFGGMLYGFSSAGNNGWENTAVLTTLIGGAIILALFIWRQFRLKMPMLDFRVFKMKTFTLTITISMIMIMALLGAETLLPIYMQTMRGYTALESGLMLLPGAIVMGGMSPLTGRLFDKFGARWLAIVGLSIVAIMTFMLSDLSSQTSFAYMVTIYAIRMFGISMVMMPVMTAGLNQLPQKLYSHGSAMANTMQQVAGSLGTAILTTVMTTVAKNQLSGKGMPDAASGQTGGSASAQGASSQLPADAMIQGMNTAMIVAASLAVLGLLLSFFIKGTKPQQASDSDEQTDEGVAGEPVTEK